MKKLSVFFLSLLMFPILSAYAQTDVTIVIDGEVLPQEGQKAIIDSDTTMIPFRTLLEGLGAYVDWVPTTKTVIAAKNETVLKLQINSNKVYINGTEEIIDSAPVIINDTTMIPLRAVSNMLNADVEWDDKTKTVSVETYHMERENKSEDEYFIKEYKSDDGETLLKVVVEYPVFTGVEYGMSVLNKNFLTHAKDFADEAIDKFAEMALAKYNETKTSNEIFEPVYVIYQHEITYDKYGLISVIEQASLATGEIVYFDSAIFSAETGNVLPYSDYVYMTEEDEQIFKAYSAYIYNNELIVMLNSSNSYLSETMGYPPAMVVPKEYIKLSLATGEKVENVITDENGRLKEVRVAYKKSSELDSALGFKMPKFKDEIVNVPEEYNVINENVGEVVYNHDSGADMITLRKAMGDADISGIENATEYKSEVYKNSMVYFMQNDNQIYASFAMEIRGDIFSYSIAVDNENKYLLTKLVKEIIDLELSK